MDTDSSLVPLALVFGAFLLLFSYLSVAEHAASVGNGHVSGKPQRGFSFTVSSLKYACVIAISLSGLALAISIQNLGWWPITILAMALLVVLTSINRCFYAIASRSPSKALRLSAPLTRWLVRNAERRTSNGPTSPSGNGNGPSEIDEEAQTELEERVIAAAESVSVDERDQEMLRSILRLDMSTVREIMVPRLDMATVDVNSSLTEVAAAMGANGHSRLPVYEAGIDRIVGVIHSKDLLTIISQGKIDTPLREAMRPAFFVPESKRLDDLLEELQERALQMAIVVDEHGGTEGLVTMEDLLEEIVGEIEDEFSLDNDPEIVKLADGSVLVHAGVSTDDVKELFGTGLDSHDVDTIGGYVYHTLGKIPQTGDVVETGQLRIEVVSILGRRLRKLRIDPIPEGSISQSAD